MDQAIELVKMCRKFNDPTLNFYTELRLEKLPELSDLPNLISLHCYNLRLKSLPEDLPENLQNLYCYFNFLTELPSSLPNLRILLCDKNNLTFLPDHLPDTLEYLNCEFNQLTQLPKVLSPNLTTLICSYNKLTSLPTLPPKLRELTCSFNQLTQLPNLPPTVTDIYCHNNQLVKLPELPSSLTVLSCQENRYLYISKPIALLAGFDPTPNYYNYLVILKKMCQSIKRKKTLTFCSRLADHIDEYLYRPGHAGYLELKKQNAGKFSDL